MSAACRVSHSRSASSSNFLTVAKDCPFEAYAAASWRKRALPRATFRCHATRSGLSHSASSSVHLVDPGIYLQSGRCMAYPRSGAGLNVLASNSLTETCRNNILSIVLYGDSHRRLL